MGRTGVSELSSLDTEEAEADVLVGYREPATCWGEGVQKTTAADTLSAKGGVKNFKSFWGKVYVNFFPGGLA